MALHVRRPPWVGPWYCFLLLGATVPIRRAASLSGGSTSSRGVMRHAKPPMAETALGDISAQDPSGRPPFAQTIILTTKLDAPMVTRLQRELAGAGLSSELSTGFNGASMHEMTEARALLKTLGYTDKVDSTFNVPFACLHTSPNHYPDFAMAATELWSHLGSVSQNFDDMLATDSHRCVAKVAAIAASHARIWHDLAERRLPTKSLGATAAADDDAWFLILEDDVEFCPHWLRRLKREIRDAPKDADMLKLSYFGHWRDEDVPAANTSSVFLEAKNSMDAAGVLSNCIKDLATGRGFASMPCTGFYAGNQAYLLKRRGAKKILAGLRGKPFQDIDVVIMDLVKTYVWRHVLAVEGPGNGPLQQQMEVLASGGAQSFLQIAQTNSRAALIPACQQDTAETSI